MCPHIYFQCTFRISYWFYLIFGSLSCRKCCQFHIKWFFLKTRWRNNAGNVETCKGICGYNSVYNFFAYFLPFKSSLFVVHFSNVFQLEALPKQDSQTKIVFLLVIFHLKQFIQGCKCFDFAKLLNLKTRLQEQHLKKIPWNVFFHYYLNLFICCKTNLKIKFMFYRVRLF